MPDTEVNFFYSNLFIAIVTFIVGAFGLFLYHRQKRDYKKRAARIILLEIKNAETQLKDAKSHLDESAENLPEHLFTMPTDSWSVNKHLFVDNFKPNEWSAINEFYDGCQLFDEAIKHNDERFAQEEKEIRRNVHKSTYCYAKEYAKKINESSSDTERKKLEEEFFERRDNLASFLTTGKNIYVYTPSKQLEIVKRCLENVDTKLSLNSAGQKLESLSKNKLWIF